jgi:hypothetical protein
MRQTTLEEIIADHKTYRAAWLSSKTRDQLESQLRGLDNLPRIDKVVCFGLSNFFNLKSGEKRHISRSHTQHLAALTIASILKERFKLPTVDVISQDPAFMATDQEFLRSVGIEPVKDSKGFLEITERTFVITVYPNICVRQIVADLTWPAAMIWATTSPTLEEEFQCRSEDLMWTDRAMTEKKKR